MNTDYQLSPNFRSESECARAEAQRRYEEAEEARRVKQAKEEEQTLRRGAEMAAAVQASEAAETARARERALETEPDVSAAKDKHRVERAADIVAQKSESVAKAKAALKRAEEACVSEPTDRNFEAAKSARRALEDAEESLGLAQSHATGVKKEIRAAEIVKINADVARREEALSAPFLNDDDRNLAAEIGYLSAELNRRIMGRQEAREKERQALDALRKSVGEKVPDYRPADSTDSALNELVRVAIAAQHGTGWGGAGHFAHPIFAAQVAGDTSVFTEVQKYGAQIAPHLERVKARRAAEEKSAPSGIAAKVAAVFGLALVLAAMFQG